MAEKMAVTLGFSPCPNDTYIFNGLVHGKVPLSQVQFGRPYMLEDVETLNDWALQGRLDVTKLSFHALGHVPGPLCAAAGRGGFGARLRPLADHRQRRQTRPPC